MPSNNSNKSFSDTFMAENRAKLFAEERADVEKTLGNGAIKFKVRNGGLRTLFAAHKRQDDTSGSPSETKG